MPRKTVLAVLLPLLLAVGCQQDSNPPDAAMTAPTPSDPTGETSTARPAETLSPASEVTLPASVAPSGASARISMQPTDGYNAIGELQLSAEPSGLRLRGTIRGLAPNGEHGFHIHQTGDCSAPDASSAGGHFAPQGEPHGDPQAPPHHAGDMPNQHADADGVIEVDLSLPQLELGTGGSHDVANRAIVLHAKRDDYTTQPAGDSGVRIACGVITLVGAETGEPADND